MTDHLADVDVLAFKATGSLGAATVFTGAFAAGDEPFEIPFEGPLTGAFAGDAGLDDLATKLLLGRREAGE